MRITRIIQKLLFITIVLIITGHSVTSHNHTLVETTPISQSNNKLTDFFKNIFCINLGEGHLEDFRIDKIQIKSSEFVQEVITLLTEISPLQTLSFVVSSKTYSYSRLIFPFYLKIIIRSTPLLRGAPIMR